MASNERREALLAANRIAELEEDPVKGSFDAAHLKEIHRRIFQDMPHYAPGQYRPDTDGYTKARSLEASTLRYHVNYPGRGHDTGVDTIMAGLGGADALRGLNADVFSAKMAQLYADLDYQHPFIEGNSRTLRSFTRQLAREAGYDLDWKRANGTEVGRDRLYIARDVEVIKRAYPGLDEARAMSTNSREEYEAYMLVVRPNAKAARLEQIVKNATFRSQDLDAANAFRGMPVDEAVKAHPDLAGSYGKLALIQKKTEADGLNPAQRALVVDRAKEALAGQVERGERPVQTISEQHATRDIDRG